MLTLILSGFHLVYVRSYCAGLAAAWEEGAAAVGAVAEGRAAGGVAESGEQ